ncbi:MAG TPA: hypothetical protein VEZ12_09990 [Herpetosiphonaceae bacterium]|nr:hypothetical protein [Herpetosiphonaceae bacterium]
MHRMLLCLIFLLLTACGGLPSIPQVQSTPEAPALLPIQTLLQDSAGWSGQMVTLVAALANTHPRVLVSGFDQAGEPIDDKPTGALWLAEPLPAKTAALLREGINYAKLRGRLSPPGAYGTDGRYPYQFVAETASVIVPEQTTLANVADNSRSMDGALIEFSGILLIGGDGTLMVDTLSSGGVPPSNARQVKIRGLALAHIPVNLEQSGAVRFGQVTATGWMQEGVLVPFWVR